MTYLGFDVREWFRSAPLRREWRARAVTFRTELDWVRYQPSGEHPGRGGSYPEVGRANPTGPAVTLMLICEYAHNDRLAL
jgi:hypothetical protein